MASREQREAAIRRAVDQVALGYAGFVRRSKNFGGGAPEAAPVLVDRPEPVGPRERKSGGLGGTTNGPRRSNLDFPASHGGL